MKRVRDAAGSSESETDGLRLGAPASQLRCPVGRRRAFLVHRRAAVVTVLALAAALAVVAVSVLFGAYNISGTDALHTLLTGSGSRMDRFFVLNQRLLRGRGGAGGGDAGAVGCGLPEPVTKSPGQPRHCGVYNRSLQWWVVHASAGGVGE